MSDARILILGRAYGRHATLEVAGTTLMWRARRGAREMAENIATTIHDVREARWHGFAWSRGGAVLLGLGAVWAASRGVAAGATAATVGLGLVIWRRLRPRQFLVLDIGDRQLILRVTDDSVATARQLARRIQRALATGECPTTPPLLP